MSPPEQLEPVPYSATRNPRVQPLPEQANASTLENPARQEEESHEQNHGC